jgi:hypothetical protein
MAQWTDGWAQLTVYPALGQLYAEHAHIFRAFGIPGRINKGQVRVNWTSGATAGSVQTGAGAPQASAAAAAQVSDTFNLDFSAIGSQAYTDIGIEMMGGGFEDQLSMEKAMSAIYDNWVYQLIGANLGSDYNLWGCEHFFAETRVSTAGMIDLAGGAANVLLDYIDKGIASLPDSGYNVCLTSRDGYNAVKKAIRALGGTSLVHTAPAEYGFSYITYSGCLFMHTRHISNDLSPTCASAPDTFFYFFNIGPDGCLTVAPGTADIWLVQGPKDTAGYFNNVWDIALKTQILYTSPRAAYKLRTLI